MTDLSLFGLIAVTLMVIFYALESKNHWFILGFVLSCLLGSVYGFLQGAWPFGIVESIWACIALRKWLIHLHLAKSKKRSDSS